MSEYSKSDILQFAAENGKIDIDTILREMELRDRRKLLDKHPYDIWRGEKDKRWFTYLPDEKKGRVLKSRKTREALEDLVIDYYKAQEEAAKRPCFREAFTEWIEERETFNELAPSSLCRYRSDFERFFPADSEFCKIHLCDMDEGTLERFIKGTICEKELTPKSYAGLRLLLIGVFKYAKREKYTNFSITLFFDNLVLPKNIFKHTHKDEETVVFSLAELDLLTNYLQEHQTTRDMAVLLQIYTGVRIGELSTLKVKDNSRNRHLRICRTEYTYFDKAANQRKTGVKEFPKTENGIRDVIIPQKAQDVLDVAKAQARDDEFLFSENHKRLTSRQLNYHLEKVCRELGIAVRSSHKIRRSYASKLLSENVDSAFIQKQMGHKQIATTQAYYHYDLASDKSKLDEIDRVIDF